MKKIIKSILSKRQFVFGTLFGLIVMASISYGVNQIQSSSVSYTKSDGTTVSVKQALDDLINKSLTRIEFLEKWLSYNTGSSLEQIKNKTEFDYSVLADVVSVGDYVAYDAGSWTETKAQPTSHGQFGGYTKDENKANSVSWCVSADYTTSLKGWRVYSINTNTKTVTLIHAGQPECYYHCNNPTESVPNLNNRATSTYLNSNYADSAHNINYNEALAITGSGSTADNNLRTIGAHYWLADSSSNTNLWAVSHYGDINSNNKCYSMGIRPIVVLKSNIQTVGKGTDKVGQSAWILVKP